MAILAKIFDTLNNKTGRVLLHYGSLLTLVIANFVIFLE
jgi:hypothetical protein